MEIMLKNAKHEHFAQLVSNGESAPRAYVLAGYSENGAEQGSSRLLKNVDVCSRVAHLRKFKEKAHEATVIKAVEASGLTKEWIIEQLMDNVAMAKAAEPVIDNEGNPIGEYKTNLAAANKSLELLGKEIGMFIDRKEVGQPGDFERLDDDELNKRYIANLEAIRAAEAAIGSAQNSARKAQKVK
jgi:phage terminase small subunit